MANMYPNSFRNLFALCLLTLSATLPMNARANVDLWPLAEFTPERTMILYPFYVHEGDFVMAFPFYYRTNQGHDNHFLWPLVKFSDGRLTRLAPFWFAADSDTFTIIPLLRQTPTYTAWAIPPIYNRHDGQFMGVFPFFAKSPDMLWIAPSYYQKTADGKSQWSMWPLYFHNKTGDTSSNMIPGLYYNCTTPSGRTLWILPSYYSKHGDDLTWNLIPFYFHNKTANSSSDKIPFLYQNERDENSHTLWIIPSLYQRTGNQTEWDLIPFYWQKKSPEKSSYTIPLLYNYSTDSKGYDLWVFPFNKVSREEDHEIGLLPFWYYSREGKPDAENKDLWLCPMIKSSSPTHNDTIVLPLYFNTWRKDNVGEWKKFWLLPYVQGSSPTDSYSGLLPFYYASKETVAGDKTHHTFSLLWPIYHRERTERSGQELSYDRRFLIFSDTKEESGARTFSMLGIPIVERMQK